MAPYLMRLILPLHSFQFFKIQILTYLLQNSPTIMFNQ